MVKWLDARVTEKIRWTDRHFSLRLDSTRIDFRAGQFIRVGLEVDGEILARPYSLVNAPHESDLEIVFNIVPEGPLTPLLSNLEPGDLVKLSPSANGFLVIEEIPESRDLWMLATGTGVGPFLSILKTSAPWQRYDRIILCYSVRTADELAYRDVIDSIISARGDQFVFLPVVTREIATGAISQRITSALQSGELEERAGVDISAEHSHIMMCGNSEMIRNVFGMLEQRGMKKHLRREAGHITTEKYH